MIGTQSYLLVATTLLLVLTVSAKFEPNGVCDIKALVPFTTGSGSLFVGTEGTSLGSSQLLGALLAVKHFNERDTVIVPELSELSDCTLTLDISDVFDASQNNNNGLQWVQEQGPPCALIGPFDDPTAAEVSVLAKAFEIPLVATGARDPTTTSRSQFTSSVRRSLVDSGKQIAEYLLWKKRDQYIAILQDESPLNFQRHETLKLIFDDHGVEWMTSSFELHEENGQKNVEMAMKAIKDRGFRTVILALSDPFVSIQHVANSAESLGMNRGGHFFVWYDDSFTPTLSNENSNITKLIAGSAWIETPPVQTLPGGSDNFGRVFAERTSDIESEAMALSPANLLQSDLLDSNMFRNSIPELGSDLIYDAVMSVGIGACLAQQETSEPLLQVHGSAHHDSIRQVSFNGASGKVSFGETGTAVEVGDNWACINVLGGGSFSVPEFTNSTTGDWTRDRSEGATKFVYQDGSNTAPWRLRDQPEQNYLSSTLRVIGFSLMGLTIVAAMGCITWTVWNRKHYVLIASQPAFLISVCLGVIVQSSAIIPISFDESYGWSEDQLGMGCMAFPWLAVLGFSTVYGSLFSKLYRINSVLQFTRRKIQTKQVVWPMAALLLGAVVILSLWTAIDPLVWNRKEIDEFTGESIGGCESENALAFGIPLIVVMLVPALLTAIMAHKTKDVDESFSESFWIFLMIVLQIEVAFVALPVVLLLDDVSADGRYLGWLFLLWIFPMTTLGMIFFPKILSHRRAVLGLQNNSVQKRGARGNARVSGLYDPNISGASHSASYNPGSFLQQSSDPSNSSATTPARRVPGVSSTSSSYAQPQDAPKPSEAPENDSVVELVAGADEPEQEADDTEASDTSRFNNEHSTSETLPKNNGESVLSYRATLYEKENDEL